MFQTNLHERDTIDWLIMRYGSWRFLSGRLAFQGKVLIAIICCIGGSLGPRMREVAPEMH